MLYIYIYKTIYIKLLRLKNKRRNVYLEFASILVHINIRIYRVTMICVLKVNNCE